MEAAGNLERGAAGHPRTNVRTARDIVENGIAIDFVIEGDVAAHIADVHVLAIGPMPRQVVPVVAISTWARCRHSTGARHRLRTRCDRGALQPHVLACAWSDRHPELGYVLCVRRGVILDLLPLLIFAHAKCANGLASSRCRFEANLTAIREGALLRVDKTRKDDFALAHIAAAGRARTAGRSLNSAIWRTNFTIAVIANFRRLHYAVTAERQFAIVVASIRRDAVAVIAFFTRFDHAIAARIRRVRQIMAIPHTATTTCTATAARAAAGRHSTAVALVIHAARLTGLDTLVRTRAGTGLRRIGNARFRAVVGITATRLQSKCG